MKFVPLIKLDNRKTAMTLCWQIVTSLVFFRLLANLEQSENRIPNEWSVKLTFSSTVTFFPFFFFDVEAIKTENDLQSSLLVGENKRLAEV